MLNQDQLIGFVAALQLWPTLSEVENLIDKATLLLETFQNKEDITVDADTVSTSTKSQRRGRRKRLNHRIRMANARHRNQQLREQNAKLTKLLASYYPTSEQEDGLPEMR